ncbi:MAG TPA: PIN domain-containing protein [Candidatus Hydrogenedentes bacterium]|nr:PIN domain-containing protein [Candidatus Hydrogenedentota bacterium]
MSRILADTSVWVDHLRSPNKRLAELLRADEVVCHSFVIGELACGNIKNRTQILHLLQALPTVQKVEDDEILLFIEQHHLMRRGLGLIDIHLLASTALSDVYLWTLDTRLCQAAKELGLAIH